jgi:hypothetical protein
MFRPQRAIFRWGIQLDVFKDYATPKDKSKQTAIHSSGMYVQYIQASFSAGSVQQLPVAYTTMTV